MHVPGANTGRVEQLYREHGAALVLFAAAIAGERSWAQDAVHQVFLRLIEDEKLSRAIDVKAYLFACVRNAVLNEAKVRQRNIELDPESAWFNPPDQNRATELELQRALRALPDEQRQVTVLHIWGGLTFSQIADILQDPSQYRCFSISLCPCQTARNHVRQRGFLCQFVKMSNLSST